MSLLSQLQSTDPQEDSEVLDAPSCGPVRISSYISSSYDRSRIELRFQRRIDLTLTACSFYAELSIGVLAGLLLTAQV